MVGNTAGSGLGPWYLARAKALSVGLSSDYSQSLGLPSFTDERGLTSRTAVYGPVRTVVLLWAERPTNRYENFDILAAALSGRVVVILDELRPWWCLIWNAWLDQ